MTLKVAYYNGKLTKNAPKGHQFYRDFLKKECKQHIEEVSAKPDITFFDKPYAEVQKLSGIKIFNYSAENIFIKKYYTPYNAFLYLSHKLHSRELASKIPALIPFSLLTLPLKRIDFSKYISFMKTKGIYSISSNILKQWNGISMPFFIQTHYDRLQQFIKKPKKNKDIPKKFCAFIVSNYNDKERISFFKRLSKYKKVDSYGRAYNNATFPKKLEEKYKDHSSAGGMNPELYKQYKFVICFENSFNNDYITEKLPNAMLGSAIPIYRGAPNVGTYFNTKSFINYDDYESYEKMIQKIIELDQDDEKYKAFLKEPWFARNKIPKSITQKYKDLQKFLLDIINNEQ